MISYRIVHEKLTGPVFVYISGENMQDETGKLSDRLEKVGINEFTILEVLLGDWDRMLTPWEADNCLKGRRFSGEAENTLEEICKILEKEKMTTRELYIAGYSLGGLFSLWTLYKTNLFNGAISGSGSLWYPGFWEFVLNNETVNNNLRIYLSLGDKEELTRHPVMSRVGDCTRNIYEHISNNNSATLEWNEGGHFFNVTERMLKGFLYIMHDYEVLP